MKSLLRIAGVLALLMGSFAYTAGWLSPTRLTPDKLVDSLAPPGGPALGHRRNHAKGICFRGVFSSDGTGRVLSSAAVFEPGEYPVIGRFNVGSPDLYVKDAGARVRGMGLQIAGPRDSLWRMAMIDLPFFPVATPQAFFELQTAAASKAPDAMQTFSRAHPEFAVFRTWLGTAPWTASYAEERYNSIDSFLFTNAAGDVSVVRWSFVPNAAANLVTPEELARRDSNFLETEIARRVHDGPLSWDMLVAAASAVDAKFDPSKPWPEGRVLKVGRLKIQSVEPEADGPCRAINYDPTVLPAGMSTSEDPFPAARASAYRRSYDLRTAETTFYPHTDSGTQP